MSVIKAKVVIRIFMETLEAWAGHFNESLCLWTPEAGEGKQVRLGGSGERGYFDDGIGHRFHGTDKGDNDLSVKLRVSAAFQIDQGFRRRSGFLVCAVACNRVISVRDGVDPSAERNLFA